MKKLYYANITIYNDLGELNDIRVSYSSLDEMALKLEQNIFQIVDTARDYAKENNMVVEEIYDSKEEAEFNKEDTTDEYRENLTETSDLNNPTNFAN